jgi:large subunit ribosomal protein L25|tara:strand:+ start:1020 stop:1718 length:699 start_codon:yes stop_codon:yes gene_type:complete
MSTQTEIEIKFRDPDASNDAKSIRKNGGVPGVLYSSEEDTVKIQLLSKDLRKAMEQPSIFSQVIQLKENDDTFKVILKDVQVNPANDQPIHVDFQKVTKKSKVTLNVPIKYINEDICIGVKNEGGMISKNKNDIELSCLADDLPEYIEIDCENLSLNSAIMQSQLILPEGVELSINLSSGQDQPVVSCSATRATLDIEDEGIVELEGEEGQEDSQASEGSSETSNEDSKQEE